jgi:hypothetical protein
MPRKKRGRSGSPAQASPANGPLSGEAMMNDLRQRIHRRRKDPNSIGIIACYQKGSGSSSSSSSSSSKSESASDSGSHLVGKWRYLNRSKIVPQSFNYTKVENHDDNNTPTPKDGPRSWHPVCGTTTDMWQGRGLTDGLGCADEEDPAVLHPSLFGSLGGSSKAQRYHYDHENTCVDGSPLTEAELTICKQFEGTWKGGFILPMSKAYAPLVSEIYTLRCCIGPGLISLTRKKAGAGRKKGTTDAQIAKLEALEVKKKRRAVSVLGRGFNEYGSFTLIGRLYLDTIEGSGDDSSATFGPHLESDKLYDEPLQKWKVKRKITIKGMRSPPRDTVDEGTRRTKRARKLSSKLITRVKQEEQLEKEIKDAEAKRKQHRLLMEQRRQERLALEKKKRENLNHNPRGSPKAGKASDNSSDSSIGSSFKNDNSAENNDVSHSSNNANDSNIRRTDSDYVGPGRPRGEKRKHGQDHGKNNYNSKKLSKSSKQPKQDMGPPPISDYDLIPEGKLIATVWRPFDAAAAVQASATISEKKKQSPADLAAAAAIAPTRFDDDGSYGLEYRVGHIDHTGETYEGEMLLGVRHGRGTCVYTNNHMYEGIWANGKEHGHGMLTDRHDELIYEGEFAEGKIHGRGFFYFSNGATYEGEFREGKRWGLGLYTSGNGAGKKQKNGNGNGSTSSISSTSSSSSTGNSKSNGKGKGKGWRKGTGKVKSGSKTPNGDEKKLQENSSNQVKSNQEGILYNGEWRDNICSGKGYWKDGRGNSYEGDWDNNMRHGHGIHVCSNGYAYEGQWKNNVPDGRGIAVYPVSTCLFFLSMKHIFFYYYYF